jgi:hypothetical protein
MKDRMHVADCDVHSDRICDGNVMLVAATQLSVTWKRWSLEDFGRNLTRGRTLEIRFQTASILTVTLAWVFNNVKEFCCFSRNSEHIWGKYDVFLSILMLKS